MKVYRGWALLCCGKEIEVHTYYKEKIDAIKDQIRTEKQIQEVRNSGVGFFMFSDHKIAKDFLYDPQYFEN